MNKTHSEKIYSRSTDKKPLLELKEAKENIFLRIDNEKRTFYQFECIQCGTCCRSLDISLVKEDIMNWMQKGKGEFLPHVQIDPYSIAPARFFNLKTEDEQEILKTFVLENHEYIGEESVASDEIIILPNVIFSGKGTRPIFIPYDFEIMLEGLSLNINYLINPLLHGKCPFLENNLCSIHEMKPLACKTFPFNRSGEFASDDGPLLTCNGFKQIS